MHGAVEVCVEVVKTLFSGLKIEIWYRGHGFGSRTELYIGGCTPVLILISNRKFIQKNCLDSFVHS